jgi:NAD(P)-dependent dehydrogenase (short-subunit alcohol dehydrogenase family)
MAAVLMAQGCGAQGLVHSGGALADALVEHQSPAGVRTAFAAKVSGASAWGPYLQRHPISAQMLFSSVASLLGSAGQSNYAAANAALDGMAGQLQQQARHHLQWP